MLLKHFDAGIRLEHDRELQIATGTTRNATIWRNKQLPITDFIRQLSRTTRTQETYEGFLAAGKKEQDEIKDVGGFVGGLLKGGRRSKDAVAYRSIMTLDADYAQTDFVDIVQSRLGEYAWTIYSTHKHAPSKPRLRLIVYPDRAMQVDEYQAVMRKVADIVGINQFDDTTYEPNRLMYWPSTASDGEFVFLHNDAPLLFVDEILAKYEDWRDVTQWPVSERETKRIQQTIGRLADPITKKGIVGAYCRRVSIHDAIDLVDVYKHEGRNRYTYTEGTSSKGVIIYDDTWIYSHHDSDPAGGMALNAFDLVRIHKYGHLDVDADHGTPVTKLASYQAMADYAKEQPGIKEELIAAGLEIDDSEFEDLSGNDDKKNNDDESIEWLKKLQVAENGSIKTTFYNAVVILENDQNINGLMAFNLLFGRIENNKTKEMWTEENSLVLRKYIGKRYQCDFSEAKAEQAIAHRAYKKAYHPIRDWLELSDWDGIPRIETLFIDWLKCEDNIYTREAAKCTLIAAVTRAFNPGFKFDFVPTLSGAQGIGKSTFVSLLGGKWYGELSSFDHKLAVEEMQGKWIMEITELSATNRGEIEQQKAFLSAQSTTVRMAYARHPIEYKRQCVFFATTNQDEYLKDSTGNRRWWPIECGIKEGEFFDRDGFRAIVSQLWAEAYMYYVLGSPVLLSHEAREIARGKQSEKRESDPWEGIIPEWLAKEADAYRYELGEMKEVIEPRDRVCTIEIWQDCLGNVGAPKRHDAMRISTIMKNQNDWEGPKTVRFGSRFGRQKGWLKFTKIDLDVPF